MALGLAGLVSAVLAVTASSSPPLEATLGDVPFTVTADRLSATPKKGLYVAEGNVVVTRPGVGLRADRVVFDEGARIAIAEGNVAVVEGSTVLMCRRVELELPGLVGGIRGAELHVKAGVIDVSTWTGTTSPESLGRDVVRLDADEVERTGRRSLELRGGAITACDCGASSTPTWSIDASAASIDLDSGAWLSWPVFYAKGLPIFALPAFYLPLGERRTGLLAPRVGMSRTRGFHFSEPLFLALGDSYDATIEAGMMLDRGFTSELELRWAPRTDVRGVLRGALLFDRGVPDGVGGYTRDREDTVHRFTIAGRSDATLHGALEGAKLAVDVNVVGDPAYVSELAAVYLERQVEATASRATLSSWTGSNVRVSGGVSWLQDLRAPRYPLAHVVPGAPAELRDVALFSSDAFALGASLHGPGAVRQRFAELRLDGLPHVLAGGLGAVPLVGEARLALSAHGALSSELARFVRADLRPELSAPISLAGLAVLEPSIALRLTAWSGRDGDTSASATRLAMIGRASLFTEVGRRFGDVVHRVRPELSYVLVPFVEASGEATIDAFDTADEVDRLTVISQVRARLVTELVRAGSGQRLAGLDVWLGRDLGLAWADEAGVGTTELFVASEVVVPSFVPNTRLALDGRAAFDVVDGGVAELVAGFVWSFPSASLGAHYGQFSDRPPTYAFVDAEALVPSRALTERVYVPLDEYRARVATEPDLAPWSDYRGLSIQGSLAGALPDGWGRVTLGASASLVFDQPRDRASVVYGPRVLRNTETRLRWDSSCECLGVGAVVVTSRDRPGFELVSIIVELAQLGTTALD